MGSVCPYMRLRHARVAWLAKSTPAVSVHVPYFLDQTPRLLLISSFAGVRLLIEGGSYSRAAFINLKQHLLVILTQ